MRLTSKQKVGILAAFANADNMPVESGGR